MNEPHHLSSVALDALRGRLTRIIPAQIRECLEKLSDEQLWWRPNEEANSVGNLVLHLSGSMRHYVARGVGGVEFKRDRAAEFSERGPIPREQLVATWDETIKLISGVLESFDAARFLDATDEPDYVPTMFDLIYNGTIHMAVHAGQIVWITKMLEQGSVDELWLRSHRK